MAGSLAVEAAAGAAAFVVCDRGLEQEIVLGEDLSSGEVGEEVVGVEY